MQNNFFSITRRNIYSTLAAWDRVFMNTNQIVIYAYHAIGETGRFSTSLKDFEKHMKFISRTHKPMKLSELCKQLSTGKKISSPVFVVTFDDGYKSVLKVADICKKFGIYPTVNIITNEKEASHVDKREHLSQKEIKRLIKSGWEIGSHTETHRKLTDITNSELAFEISNSKEKAEKKTDRVISVIAYPLGRYNQSVLTVAKKLGYKTGLTMDDAIINTKTSLLTLPRIGVDTTHSPIEFTYLASPTVVRFRAMLKNSPFKTLFINI